MRTLQYAINITLDGCCDHRAGLTDVERHRYWAEKLAEADALLFGRVTHQMMEAAWRMPADPGSRPEWMDEGTEPFARTIDAAKKYVASSTLERVDWNAEILRGDLPPPVPLPEFPAETVQGRERWGRRRPPPRAPCVPPSDDDGFAEDLPEAWPDAGPPPGPPAGPGRRIQSDPAGVGGRRVASPL